MPATPATAIRPTTAIRPATPTRTAILIAFAIHAVITTSIGARMPAIRDQAGLDAPTLGLALAIYAVALLLGTRVGPRLVTRWGSRLVLRTTIPLLCLSLVGVALCRDLGTLAAALAWLGLLSGLIDASMNIYAVELERRLGRPIMSGIHAAWSAGMLTTGAIAWVAVSRQVALPVHLTVLALVLGVASVALLARLDDLRQAPVSLSARADTRTSAVLMPLLTLGAIAFASFVAEGTMFDWGTIYLEDVGGIDPGDAVVAYMANALGMLVARLVGDRLVTITGPVALVRASGVAIAVALAVVITFPQPLPALAAYAVVGFASGPIFPIALSAAGATDKGQGPILGWVVSLAYLGSVAGPMLLGLVAGVAGLRAAFVIPLVMGLVIAILAVFVSAAAGGTRPPTEADAEMPPI